MTQDRKKNPYAPQPAKAVSDKKPAAEAVPDGTADEILRWVDGDKTKAQRALAKEKSGHGRVTVIKRLSDLL